MTSMFPEVNRFMSRRSVFGGLLLLCMLSMTACDDSVNPFVEEDRFYSVYGYLDTGVDEQFVRVVPLRTDFAEIDAENIDAVVTTTDLDTGEVQEWVDTVVEYADGSIGHVFRGDFRPYPGHTYELKVLRSDGITTTAQTTVPPAFDAEILEPSVGGGFAIQRVRWPGLDFRPFRVEVWYRFLNPVQSEPYQDAVLVYGEEKYGQYLQDGSAWEVQVRLSEDKEDVTEELDVSKDAEPTLGGLGIRLTMTDDGWRPPDAEGQLDPEVLVQPGTFSNVVNGFGFFGSVNQFTVEWMVSETVVRNMGYSYPE